MKTTAIILIFVFFFKCVVMLRIELLHNADTTAQQTYLTQLLNIENTLSKQLNQLTTFSNAINNNITVYSGYPNIQTQVLITGIATQQSMLYNINNQLILPLNKKSWDCKLLKQNQVDSINNQISQIQQNITILQQRLNSQPACQQNNQILSQNQYLNSYVDHLAKQVSASCGAPVSKVVYVRNPNNLYYVYGTQGQQAYNKDIQSLLNQQYTKIQCPVQQPYPNNNQCVTCPQDKLHFYDLTQKACLACPERYIFIPLNHTCLLKSFNNNPQGNNYTGTVPTPVSGMDTCPVQTPYYNGKNCIGCPTGSLFDFGSLECKACPTGYQFYALNHSCITKPINSNLNNPNFIGTIPAPISGAQTCPNQTPFYNGNSCIGCPNGSFFDFATNQCISCPNGTVFDSNTHLCIYKKFNTNINSNSTNICCGNLSNDPSAQTCPDSAPFFNGKLCIQCQLPAYFSIQTLTCTICPQNQQFSLIKKKCIDKKFTQQVFTSAISQQIQNYYGTPPKYDPQYQKVVNCPTQTPFFNGANCILCTLPSYYNFNTNKCQFCQQGYRFDISTHNCMEILTAQMNNNMVVLNNFIGQIPDFNNTLATCPNDKPFFNGINCIQCVLPNYVDFNTMKCQSCNPNYNFNIANRQCTANNPQFYTNIRVSNIFYNGDFNNIATQTKSVAAGNPNAQQCTPQLPYFNAQNNTCMACSTQYPLFDYKYNRCIACSTNSKYNTESRICTMNGQVSATVQRMIMNTVGWI